MSQTGFEWTLPRVMGRRLRLPGSEILCKTALLDCLSHGGGESHQLGDVVDAQQGQTEQFLTADEVMDVGACMRGAGQTAAARIEGRVIVAESGIAQVPAFAIHAVKGKCADVKTYTMAKMKIVNNSSFYLI